MKNIYLWDEFLIVNYLFISLRCLSNILDLDQSMIKQTWKNFVYIKEDNVQKQLEKLCRLLGNFGTYRIVSDFLLDVIFYQPENRKEAIFILNEVTYGHDVILDSDSIMKDILDFYTESTYWDVPVVVCVDEFAHRNTLNEVHSNAVQVCLLIEGIGKIALKLQKGFERFMLTVLYMVLEKAGKTVFHIDYSLTYRLSFNTRLLIYGA